MSWFKEAVGSGYYDGYIQHFQQQLDSYNQRMQQIDAQIADPANAGNAPLLARLNDFKKRLQDSIDWVSAQIGHYSSQTGEPTQYNAPSRQRYQAPHDWTNPFKNIQNWFDRRRRAT